MINLTKGNTETIYFTGTENALLTAPNFLFVFTHSSTNEVVKLVGVNTSNTKRYDKFQLVVNTKFTDSTEGLWNYKTYEQASSTNTDPAGLNLVEEGYMYLHGAAAVTDIYNDQDNTFKAYDGQL